MIVDSHVHLSMSKDGLGPILEACDRLGIEKVCLLASYRDLKKAVREAPDRVIPVVRLDVDRESSSFVHLLADSGIHGLKFICPQLPYDDEAYYGFYSTAQEYGMPILFHTGICGNRNAINDNMRPVHLDHLARTFPDLNMIMAHLGNPWWPEAAMALRQNANLYADLSGSSLKKRPPDFFRTLLWWADPKPPYEPGGGKHPFQKLLFGTDVAPHLMEDVHTDYQRLMEGMDVSEEHRAAIMGGTAAELYGVEG